MPEVLKNLALEALAIAIQSELIFGEVTVRKSENGWNLFHRDDSNPAGLRPVKINELRGLAQLDATGAFRPLSTAPTLVSGWVCSLANADDVYRALNVLYPSAVPDWYAAKSSQPPATHYRPYTQRQTGMYRIAAMLNDADAADVIRHCCNKSLCLKRRLWSVEGLTPDAPKEKSVIPCLEPCAILLELARKTARIVLDKQAAEVKA